MNDTITRWECPECGITSFDWPLDGIYRPEPPPVLHANDCPGVSVERTYVAVDALLGMTIYEATPGYIYRPTLLAAIAAATEADHDTREDA